jgi:hypothetical protein
MNTCTMLIHFTGKGEPIGHAAGCFLSRAEGAVLALESAGSAAGDLQVPTRRATFETVVMARGEQTFESGRVDFPDIASWLDVDTVIPGRVSTRDDGISTGSISWRVVDGGGQFEGATGIVTGNFIGYPDGTFSDHQVFKLVLAGPMAR